MTRPLNPIVSTTLDTLEAAGEILPRPALAASSFSDPILASSLPLTTGSATATVASAPSLSSFDTAVSTLESEWAARGVSLSDPLGIPEFLKRASDNIAPFARAST